ncbi:MAG: VWA domain-containing protein [Polyangiaceae bacterium]|nr:VWA domain-containing protein [Polyangiaceae bacterium]
MSLVLGLAACSSAGGAGAEPEPTGAGGSGATGGTSAGESGAGGEAGSGGGASGSAGSVQVGGNNAGGSGIKECQSKETPGKRIPAALLIVLDRSGSMSDAGKWPAATGALNQMLNAADPELAMGLVRFPEGTNSGCPLTDIVCQTNYECTDIKDIPNVPVGPLKETGAQIQNLIATTKPNGGTPTLWALRKAYKYMSELETDSERFVLLVTDGVPTFLTPPIGPFPEMGVNCGNKGELGTATSDARKANPPVRTFVIGAPGSEDGLEILSGLALNGGTCRPGGSHSSYTCHYQIGAANFEQDLAATLTQIAGSVSSCTYAVPVPSGEEVNPDLVNVIVTAGGSETTIVKDTSQQDGWDYTDESKTKIQIFGPQCEAINKGTEATVKIALGCQTKVK